jgi:hypothetical protein
MPRRAPITECERRYSVQQAAEVTALSVSTLKHAVADAQRSNGKSGPWPLELFGARVLIPASSLDSWLRRYRTT